MRRLTSRGYVRRGLAGGVAFAYFSLIGLPVLFFGAGMATDFTRIIVANRQVSNATQAAALAGAQQFVPGVAAIDPTKAVYAARDTYCVAQAAGMMRNSAPYGPGTSCPRGSGRASITVTPVSANTGGGPATVLEVRVTAQYSVTGLMFARIFGGGSTFVPGPISRSAAICLPGVATGPTNGYCARPNAASAP